jgi:hypothetical protein
MLRGWFAAVTLVGLVLTGAAMTTHASATPHPVDAVVAAAHSLGEASPAVSPHSHEGETMTGACADCAGESKSGGHAMLMALGCAFVAMLTVALVAHVRTWVALSMPRPRMLVARTVSALAVVLQPPDLLALGISRT